MSLFTIEENQMKIVWRILGFAGSVCATVVVYLCVGYLFYPAQFGRAWANFDLMRNHYEIRYFGFTFMDDVYHFYFQDHGIDYTRVAWCVVNIPIIESTKSYNETMRDAILRDKGIDVYAILESGTSLGLSDNEK